MPCELLNFVIAFAPLFSKPVFKRVEILLTGAILSPVSRTVTNALRATGLSQEKHFENYHRVLNRDQWSSLKASRILLNLLVKAFGLSGELVISNSRFRKSGIFIILRKCHKVFSNYKSD